VDPGKSDFMPESMHIAGNRIAILFREPQTYEKLMRVVDFKGHVVASYYEPPPKLGEQSLGLGFACYAHNPERFTFLVTTDNGKLGLVTATPE
jgi:hypothetical protein